MRYLASVGEREIPIELTRRGAGRYSVRIDGQVREVESRGSGSGKILTVEGRDFDATLVPGTRGVSGTAPGRGYTVIIGGRIYPVRLEDPLRRASRAGGTQEAGRIDVCSIMPGRITALLVREGEEVQAGKGLIIVEAMKMENEIPAPKSGRVISVKVQPGETVEAGAVLLSLE
jgi:biotin carboxyl carrier protein